MNEKEIEKINDIVKSAIEEAKDSKELIVLENELLGLKVQMLSKSLSNIDLQKTAHESLMFMMKKTPTRVPLGVD